MCGDGLLHYLIFCVEVHESFRGSCHRVHGSFHGNTIPEASTEAFATAFMEVASTKASTFISRRSILARLFQGWRIRILRSHFNGMGWAHLGCVRDGDGTGSWNAFHQWGSHVNPRKPRWDGMGLDETNGSHGGGTPLGLCHWQCGIVREIQYGTTRPQQPTPNEEQTI